MASSGKLNEALFDALGATVYAPCLWLADHNPIYLRYIAWWMELG